MPRKVQDTERCRQSYSQDLRERVVYLRYNLKYKIDEIAVVLNMSKHVVERTLQLWRNTGEVMSSQQAKDQKRARVMSTNEIEVCY
jgi:transposase